MFSVSAPDLKINGTIKLKMKDFDSVLSWILLNQDAILDYWNMKISTKTLANSLIKL